MKRSKESRTDIDIAGSTDRGRCEVKSNADETVTRKKEMSGRRATSPNKAKKERISRLQRPRGATSVSRRNVSTGMYAISVWRDMRIRL